MARLDLNSWILNWPVISRNEGDIHWVMTSVAEKIDCTEFLCIIGYRHFEESGDITLHST